MEDAGIPQKKHKPEDIVAKLRQVDVLVSQGRSVAEAVRSIGVTQFTYYRWRKEYGALKTNQVKRLKELELMMPHPWPAWRRCRMTAGQRGHARQTGHR
jgi:ACT domain-containing protein